MPKGILYHGSAVFWHSKGLIFTGDSGSGKSDACLRLIAQGATLIADDQIHLYADQGRLYADAPEQLKGLLEIRGLGLYEFPYKEATPVDYWIELTPTPPRYPEQKSKIIDGVSVSCLSINPFEVSFCYKILCLVGQMGHPVDPVTAEDCTLWSNRKPFFLPPTS